MINSVTFNKECLLPWGGISRPMEMHISPKWRCNILQKCLQLFPKKTCKKQIYGKILCYSICGLIYTCADDQMISKRSEEGRKTQYDYLPNMKYICDTIRLDQRFLQCFINQKSNEEKESYFSELLHDCAKNIVPVRAGRHYRRWGKWMSQIPTAKFRIDGRRDPPIRKCFKVNGYITTQHG